MKALLGCSHVCQPILFEWHWFGEKRRYRVLEVKSVARLNMATPLQHVTDYSLIELLEGLFFVGFDVVVFTIVAVFPLSYCHFIEMEQKASNPLTSGFLGSFGQ